MALVWPRSLPSTANRRPRPWTRGSNRHDDLWDPCCIERPFVICTWVTWICRSWNIFWSLALAAFEMWCFFKLKCWMLGFLFLKNCCCSKIYVFFFLSGKTGYVPNMKNKNVMFRQTHHAFVISSYSLALVKVKPVRISRNTLFSEPRRFFLLLIMLSFVVLTCWTMDPGTCSKRSHLNELNNKFVGWHALVQGSKASLHASFP